ncbi:hypothetical protein [Eubacterium sp. ER2]|uniref:hypothetical protein n=1 Tax=Eubacterium sp. ER2 TaxID=1519438 RepID=UPI0011CA339D|nr:hypothetical protein [Eubacterium sp. ER2]
MVRGNLFPATSWPGSKIYWLYVVGSILLMYLVSLGIEALRNFLIAHIERSKVFDKTEEKLIGLAKGFINRVAVFGDEK